MICGVIYCNFSARTYVIVFAEKNDGNEKIFIISDSKRKKCQTGQTVFSIQYMSQNLNEYLKFNFCLITDNGKMSLSSGQLTFFILSCFFWLLQFFCLLTLCFYPLLFFYQAMHDILYHRHHLDNVSLLICLFIWFCELLFSRMCQPFCLTVQLDGCLPS